MRSEDQVVVLRDCDAIEIPGGQQHTVERGAAVRILQTLGDTYTVMTGDGYMLRIEGKDADALGITSAAPLPQEMETGSLSEQMVWDQLKTVFDPEIPVNIVDLGLVYSCRMTPGERGGSRIEIKMSMTAPGCGMGNILKADIERKLLNLSGVEEVQVEVVFDPPWNPGMMSEAARLKLGLELEPTDSRFPIYNRGSQ